MRKIVGERCLTEDNTQASNERRSFRTILIGIYRQAATRLTKLLWRKIDG